MFYRMLHVYVLGIATDLCNAALTAFTKNCLFFSEKNGCFV